MGRGRDGRGGEGIEGGRGGRGGRERRDECYTYSNGGRFFGISDKSCKIFFSEFYQIMSCIMFADN